MVNRSQDNDKVAKGTNFWNFFTLINTFEIHYPLNR